MRISPLICVSPSPRTSLLPFNVTCYSFSVSSVLGETWQKVEAGTPPGWGGSGAAGARQLLPVRGARVRGKGTRASAAASRLVAHPPAEGLRSNARSRVPAWVPEGRRSPPRPPLRRPGAEVCEGARGDRGRRLGGAKPARVQTFGHGPTCSGRRALGQPVSRDCHPVALRAEHRRGPCALQPLRGERLPRFPGQLRPRETSRGNLSMGSDGWPWARRASCLREEEPLWTLSGAGGGPPTEEIFTVFSSQGRPSSLDEVPV